MPPLPLIIEDEDRELLHAEALIWDQLLNFIKSMSLKCAVQLGIPDAIHSHGRNPMPLSDLIDSLSINASKSRDFERFMRILTHSGFFCKHESDTYSLTPMSRLLLKNEPLSVRPLVLAVLDPAMMSPWQNLTRWFRNGDRTAFKTTHRSEFWEYTGREGERLGSFFDDAMANDSRLVTRLVLKYYVGVFEGLSSLVDVGGGTGTVAKGVARGFPEMKCTVLDLPHVVAGLEGSDNVTYIAGDMFQFIPPADAVLLKWILHDWSDEESVKILKKCKVAIDSSKNKGAKVIVIDMVMVDSSQSNDDSETIETQLLYDMQMMVLLNGRERKEKEWAKLFFDAGFSRYKISPILGLRSLVEVYP